MGIQEQPGCSQIGAACYTKHVCMLLVACHSGTASVGAAQVFSGAFSSMFAGEVTDESLRAAFDEIDTDRSGLLDRNELATAMRKLGKSEREVDSAMQALESSHLDFEQFKDLIVPPSILSKMRNIRVWQTKAAACK